MKIMYTELQNAIDYQFKNPALLERALTHSSYANEQNAKTGTTSELHNEMMEFLGDSVLGFTIAEYLYTLRPMESEGGLSRKRAAIVCERALATCARNLGLGDIIRLGKSADKVKDRDKPSILSDAMEAVFAAVYLDDGIDTAKKIILTCLADTIDSSVTDSLITDYKTCLQELLHNEKVRNIEYMVTHEDGPDHDKTFTSQVSADGKVLGTGTGSSKKESEQNAAKEALNSMSD